jgi:hypothetical protein
MSEPSRHHAIREQLLGPTLEFCSTNVPWYRERWGDSWRDIKSVGELHKLPLLDKQQAIRVQDRLRSGVEAIGSPVLSSGTARLGAQLLEVLHSNAELEEQDRYLELLAAADAQEEAKDAELSGVIPLPQRRELVVVDAHHGLPFERSSPLRMLVPFGPHENSVLQIRSLLERVFEDGSRIEALLISVTNLKALTLWLLDRGVDPAALAVRNIGTNSSPLAGPWRRRLERLWDARVWDNYSISELRSPAAECALCGLYHFDQVPVVHELIDPLTGRPRQDWGELVLTTLYPYAQAMPLIRYRTGDLLYADEECETGERGYGFLGRDEECGLLPDDDGNAQLMFAPGPLLDIVDGSPDFALRPHLFEQLGLLPPGSIGEPWVDVTTTVDEGNARVDVRARLRWHPAVFHERAAALRDEVTLALVRALPALEEEAAAGRATIEVELLPPPSATITAPVDFSAS